MYELFLIKIFGHHHYGTFTEHINIQKESNAPAEGPPLAPSTSDRRDCCKGGSDSRESAEPVSDELVSLKAVCVYGERTVTGMAFLDRVGWLATYLSGYPSFLNAQLRAETSATSS